MDSHPAFSSVGQEDGWPLAKGPALEKLAVSLSSTWQPKVLANTTLPLQSVISKTKPNPRYKRGLRKCFPSSRSVLGAVGLGSAGT